MMDKLEITIINCHQVAALVRDCVEKAFVIDSRSFLEFNLCHILHSFNVCCSKIVKRRLEQGKISVKELLVNQLQSDDSNHVIVYDQSTHDLASISKDTFLWVFLKKLKENFKNVYLVEGGFLLFKALHPSLCEDKTRKCPLTAISQPCLSHKGLTKILPFLYLGSQSDSANKDILKSHNITYELNVSNNCPKSDYIQDNHFLRIPVNDNYSEKLLPHFETSNTFLDRVQQSNGAVLVHCLAGISRSPSIAIAYVMCHLRMTSDEAYRYIKAKRPSISPNFNFLGQLQEYEKMLKIQNIIAFKPEPTSAPIKLVNLKRFCPEYPNNLSLDVVDKKTCLENSSDLSPTTAFARLNFNSSPTENFSKNRSVSCFEGFLPNKEDSKVEWSETDVRQSLYSQEGTSLKLLCEKATKRLSFSKEDETTLQVPRFPFKLERNLSSSTTSGVGSETLEHPIQEDVMEESVFEELINNKLKSVKPGSLKLELGLEANSSLYQESPLSPSERHFLEDLDEPDLKCQTVYSPVKESIDSGVILSPTIMKRDIKSALEGRCLYRAQSCPIMVQTDEVQLRKTSLRASVGQLGSSSRPVSLIQVS